MQSTMTNILSFKWGYIMNFVSDSELNISKFTREWLEYNETHISATVDLGTFRHGVAMIYNRWNHTQAQSKKTPTPVIYPL